MTRPSGETCSSSGRGVDQAAVLDLEDGAEPVRVRLVGTEEAEVRRSALRRVDVAQQLAEPARRFRCSAPASRARRSRSATESGSSSATSRRPPLACGSRAHPLLAGRARARASSSTSVAALVEALLGPVAAHPLLQHRQVLGVLAHVAERHLVGAEGALDLQAVDLARAGPALRRAQHDRRPARPPASRPCAGARAWIARDRRAAVGRASRRSRGGPRAGSSPSTKRGARSRARPAARAIVLLARAAEHRRPGDLVLVEVQDRQHGAVARRVEEADPLPRALQRPGLGLAVADHAGDQQVGVVEGGAEGVHERVAELTALVDRARGRDADVAGDAAGRRELADQPPQPGLVAATPADRPPSRCPRGRRWRPPPGRRGRDRRRRGRRPRSRGSAG